MTANYGETGAINLYGPAHGLPEAIGVTNSAWERGFGNPAPKSVILVGFGASFAQRFFTDCRYAGKVSNQYGVANEESTRQPDIIVCNEPRMPWTDLWQQIRNFG